MAKVPSIITTEVNAYRALHLRSPGRIILGYQTYSELRLAVSFAYGCKIEDCELQYFESIPITVDPLFEHRATATNGEPYKVAAELINGNT